MIPPEYFHSYYLQWSLILLRYVCLIYPLISMAIISKRTISWKFCIQISLPTANCVRYDTIKGFGRVLFKFPVTCSKKYPCAIFCISLRIICYTTLNMLFAPVPVFTMNARRIHPYLFAKLIKWSMVSLSFGT